VPDLVTTAKSLGGGLPIGAVTGRAQVMDAVHAGGLGGTFGGNPVSCATALAAIETIEADGLLARARHLGERMTTRLRTMADHHAVIGDVRGRGAMVAIELVGTDGRSPDRDATSRIAAACHRQGLLVLTAGNHGNVIRFLTPLTMPDHLLDEGLDILDAAIGAA
jgi:4-aminobutyrate aminotransferase / (S)-3-amino-2-methylpropionate transaminase / 5-aminovalerate transaminase